MLLCFVGIDIQRELLRRSQTQGDSENITSSNNSPTVVGGGEKPAMSAIEYNTVNIGNVNLHHQNHGTVMLNGNGTANLLYNYCPPAAKRKKPNHVESPQFLQANSNSEGRIQIQQRAVLNATTVPITLTPVTNALIRQEARYNVEDFDPVKLFGELTQTGLATPSGTVIGADGGFGTTLLAAGFNATQGGSNLLDHSRILSFTTDSNRAEESGDNKRSTVNAPAKQYQAVSASTVVQVPNGRGETQTSSTKKTGSKGKKTAKVSKNALTSNPAPDTSKNNGSSSPKRKLKSMSIEEKYYVLQRLLKPDVSQATICEEMQLNKSVVSRIWCDRFKIEELYKQGSGNRIKVKYMHNGPAHPKKRGHGKKAKALAKQQAAAAASNNKSFNSSNNQTNSNNQLPSTTINPQTTSSSATYNQNIQQQSTMVRPTLLGLYAASTTSNPSNTGRVFEHNNARH